MYSKTIVESFITVAKEQSLEGYPVHIKFNTGLNRLGFSIDDISYLSDQIKERNEIKVMSLFSHLAASEDESETEFTQKQIELFESISRAFEERLRKVRGF